MVASSGGYREAGSRAITVARCNLAAARRRRQAALRGLLGLPGGERGAVAGVRRAPRGREGPAGRAAKRVAGGRASRAQVLFRDHPLLRRPDTDQRRQRRFLLCAAGKNRRPAVTRKKGMIAGLRRIAAALILAIATPALGDPIQVSSAGLEVAETRYALFVDFRLDLTPQLLQALNNGVSLGFLVEFELSRPRWYWFNQKTASEKL